MTAAILTVVRPAQYRLPVESLTAGMAVLRGSYTFSSDYATGGEAFTFAPEGQGVEAFLMHNAGGYTFEYVAGKLKAYTTAATEVALHTDLSALGAIPFVAFVTRRQH